MNQLKTTCLTLFCLAIFVCTGCNNNHLQRDFGDQALNTPTGIQAMTAAGEHKSDSESDPTDWRTAPEFTGLFKVETPAYPNPVSYNSTLTILINVKAFNAVNGLRIYAFRQPGDFQIASPIQIIPNTLQPGLRTIRIMPSQFASTGGTGNLGNTYRLIFLDGRNRIITYGDVQVK